MAFTVYRPEEIFEFKNAVGKYVCIQGNIYCVSEKVSKEDFYKERDRRAKLPQNHADFKNYQLVSMEEDYYICVKQYFNGI